MIDFYYAPTPNGWKVAIMLEECEFAYNPIFVRLTDGDQFAPEYLNISPNAKMPAIVDHNPPTSYDGSVNVFESGAIMIYLAEKSGKFMPTSSILRKEALEWLFWQVGNQGPMGGQYSHFINYAPQFKDKGYEYSSKRYKGEYERSLAVLNIRLEGRAYILGCDYSVADMISFPWAFIAKAMGVPLEDFPNVAAWRGRIKGRKAVQRAINLYKDQQNHGANKATATTNKILYNQSAAHFRIRKI